MESQISNTRIALKYICSKPGTIENKKINYIIFFNKIMKLDISLKRKNIILNHFRLRNKI